MPLIKSKSPQAFKKNLETEMSAGKPQKQALAIAYSMKKRQKLARGGVAMQCPACLEDVEHGGRCDAHSDNRMASGGEVGQMNQMEKDGDMEQKPNRAAESNLDNEGYQHDLEPHGDAEYDTFRMRNQEAETSGMTSGSPTLDKAVGETYPNPMSIAEHIMKKRKDSGSEVAKHYASGGYVDSSEDDLKSEHDYSMLPAGKDAQTIPGEEHDSDMPDDAQQESLVGQLIKKRRQLKK